MIANTIYQPIAKKPVQPKMRGHKRGRYAPRYPSTAEREYRRINRAYVNVLSRSMKRHLPEVMKAYRREMRKDSREDGIFDFLAMVHSVILIVASEISIALEELDMQQKVENIARMVQGRSVTEWIAAVKNTFGVDLLPSYYKGDTYEQVIKQWIAKNFSYLQGMPMDALLSIEAVIGNAYRNGMDADKLEEQLQGKLNSVMSRAEWAARDQVSSLNAGLMKQMQTESGSDRYIWKSMGDGDVRDCHMQFDGHVYSWDEPPDDWYITKTRGIVYSGECYNPGEGPGCRCVAIPVFDMENLNLPVKETE